MIVAHAHCRRCSAPAHPTTGYCSRFCWECDVFDRERGRSFSVPELEPLDDWDAFFVGDGVSGTTISNADWDTPLRVEELRADILRMIDVMFAELRA